MKRTKYGLWSDARYEAFLLGIDINSPSIIYDKK